jgi:hypothetical protein
MKSGIESPLITRQPSRFLVCSTRSSVTPTPHLTMYVSLDRYCYLYPSCGTMDRIMTYQPLRGGIGENIAALTPVLNPVNTLVSHDSQVWWMSCFIHLLLSDG